MKCECMHNVFNQKKSFGHVGKQVVLFCRNVRRRFTSGCIQPLNASFSLLAIFFFFCFLFWTSFALLP